MFLDLELLEAFVAIVDGGGFTRAGERLHKTQSTISQQLKRLEERAGTPLLVRSARGLSLTGQGEVLLGYARRMLALHSEAVRSLDTTKLKGRVRLGSSQDVAEGGLPQILTHFTRRYPGVCLEVRVDTGRRLREALASGALDLAVVVQEPGTGGEVIQRTERVWVAHPDFCLPVNEPLPLVLFDEPCIFRTAALDALERAGIPWRVALTTPSLAGVRAAVRAGLGVTVRTPRWLETDLRTLGESDGLPGLPNVELAAHIAGPNEDTVIARLLESIRIAVAAPCIGLA